MIPAGHAYRLLSQPEEDTLPLPSAFWRPTALTSLRKDRRPLFLTRGRNTLYGAQSLNNWNSQMVTSAVVSVTARRT